ncbi:MAG TPA: amidohydrolase family protein [Myxococcaceae bacterium]
MRMLHRFIPLAVLLLTTACGHAKLVASVHSPARPGGYLFSQVNVFDGEQPLGPRDVLVRNDRIEAVAPAGTLTVPEAIRIDGTGKTLLPGLVDAHAHLESNGEALWDLGLPDLKAISAAYLYSGVTSAMVLQGGEDQFELQADAAKGKLLAPHMMMCGPRLTAPDGFPISLIRALLPWPISKLATSNIRTAATVEEAQEVVDDIAEEFSPPLFKLTSDALPPGTPKLSGEVLAAAIRRVKERKMRSVAHIGAPEDVMIAAEAGLDLFAHPPSGGLLTDEQLARLKELRIPFVTTLRFLTASQDVAADGGTALERSTVHPETLTLFAQPPKDFEFPGAGSREEFERQTAGLIENVRRNAKRLHEAGVPLFIGTDGGSPGVFPGASIHRELALLVSLGVSPAEALRAATSAPADFMDPARSFGRIAPGQRADLLLVRGDPLTRIEATADIDMVLKDGVALERKPAP